MFVLVVSPPYSIYVGEDKHESEFLVKGISVMSFNGFVFVYFYNANSDAYYCLNNNVLIESAITCRLILLHDFHYFS